MTAISEPVERDDIAQAMDELEALGMIRRTGEFRDGQPVFEMTELGRAVHLNVSATVQ